MNCPACSGNLLMRNIEDLGIGPILVHRECKACHFKWLLTYQRKGGSSTLESVSQENNTKGEYGFDYTCPKCNVRSTVYTVYKAKSWTCITCGGYIPPEAIKVRGGFVLPEVIKTTKGSKKTAPGVVREPRASRPVPAGAVSLSTLASTIGIEPKKLRSWLRKNNWRAAEEARTSWVFSPEEAKDITGRFGK